MDDEKVGVGTRKIVAGAGFRRCERRPRCVRGADAHGASAADLRMDKETREERRRRQTREVEESQKALRDSIAKTQSLLDQSDAMLKRHRRESEDGGQA